MKIPYESPQRRPRIEIVPLIDVIFFLLASFLMVSLSMVKNQGIPVRLPAAATGRPQPVNHTVTITVARSGNVYLNKQAMGFEALRRRLETMSREDPELRVILSGDTSADFGIVVKALDEMRRIGVERVALQTAPGDSSSN